jgi:hypothetical protein
MTITDYASLQAAVAAYMHRDDLTDVIPTFIQLAEQRIYPRLKSAYNRGRGSYTQTSLGQPNTNVYMTGLWIEVDSVAWVPNWTNAIAFRSETKPINLRSVSVDQLNDWRIRFPTTPKAYQLTKLYAAGLGTTVQSPLVENTPATRLNLNSATIEQTFFVTGWKLPVQPLATATQYQDAISLLLAYPGLFLNGALLEAYNYTQDVESYQKMLPVFEAGLAKINSDTRESIWGSGLTMSAV